MSPYLTIILKIAPIIALFLIGALLRKIDFFKAEVVAGLKKLVVNITLPSLLFLAFASSNLKLFHLLVVGAIFLVCLAMLYLGRGIGKAIRVPSPYFPFLLAGFETGMLGYAIYTTVVGLEHIDKLALIDLGQVLFVFFVLMPMLIKIRGQAGSAKEVGRLFITSPVIVSIFAGIAVSLIHRGIPIFGNPAWRTIENLATMVGSVTTPLICIVIGFELKFAGGKLGDSIKTIAIRTALLVAAAVLLNRFFLRGALGLSPLHEYALMTMFVLPPPFVISVFMDEKDTKNNHYVANTLSLNTLVSVGMFIIVSLI